MQVRDLLRARGTALFTVRPDCVLSQCVVTMADEDIDSVVVMDGTRVAGLVTFREVINLLAQRQKGGPATGAPLVGELRVQDVMLAEPLSVDPATELKDLRAAMIRHRQRYVPVVDGQMLAGVLSLDDVARAVNDEQTFENRMLKAYIHDWPDADAAAD